MNIVNFRRPTLRSGYRFIFLCLFVLTSGWATSASAYREIVKTSSEIPPVESSGTSTMTKTTDEALDEAFRVTLAQYNSQYADRFMFAITNIRTETGFAYATAVPIDQFGQPVKEEVYIVLLAHQNIAGKWLVFAPKLVPSQEYNTVLESLPDTLVDSNTKAFIYQYDSTFRSSVTALNISGHKLPWPDQKTAQLRKKGNCYVDLGGVSCVGSGHELQLDFNIEGTGISGDVYASKPGTVVFVKESNNDPSCSTPPTDGPCWKKANMVVIQHSASEYSWYVHLAYNSVPVSVGNQVGFGTKIGVEGATGFASGVHLHFMTSTGHTSWTDPNNPNDAPWATAGTITAVDFTEVSWDSLAVGSWYKSENRVVECPNVSGIVRLFDLVNCGGSSIDAKLGLTKLEENNFNDKAESIAIPNGWSARLYLHNSETSPSACITSTDSNLGDNTFDNGTKVANEATWIRVYDNSNCGPPPMDKWHAEYFSDQNWSSRRCDRYLDGSGIVRADFSEDWREGAPTTNCSGMPTDHFSVRYTGNFLFGSERYWFHVNHDDGARIFVNDTKVQDWSSSGEDCPEIKNLNSGNNKLVIDYQENTGSAHISLEVKTGPCVSPPTTPSDPNPPENGTVSRTNDTVLSWSTTGDSCDIHIWGGDFGDHAFNGQGCSSFHLGSQYGGIFHWQVNAHNSAGNASGPTWTFYAQPYEPTNLTANAVSSTEIDLFWTKSSDDPGSVDSYNIYRDGSKIASVAKGLTSYQAGGLTCNTVYSFYIKAVRQEVESAASNKPSVTTQPCPNPDLIPDPRPGRSVPVVISSGSGPTTNDTLYAGKPVFIDWGYKNNGSENAPAHNVKMTIDGQTIVDQRFDGLNAGATNGFDDMSTTWPTAGTFTVSLIVDSNSEVDESNEDNNVWSGQFTWVEKPADQLYKIAPTNEAPNQPLNVTLKWSNNSGANSYQYCYDTIQNSDCDSTWKDVGTATSADLSVLSPGTTYYWQVCATTSSGSTCADNNTWWSFSTVSTSGPRVSTTVSLPSIKPGDTAVVSVSLLDAPPNVYASAELSCEFNPAVVEASNPVPSNLFGADAVFISTTPKNGSFIAAIAGSNGNKATTSGVVFTFNIKGLQPGQTTIECTGRISKGDNFAIPLPSSGSLLKVQTRPDPLGILRGQVIASKPVSVDVRKPDNAGSITVPIQADGVFILPISPGNYTVNASAKGFLSAQGSVTIPDGDTITLPTIKLLAGDIDGNNVIDQLDALTIGMNYGTTTPPEADLNNDSVIDFLDLELLAMNYMKTGPVPWK